MVSVRKQTAFTVVELLIVIVVIAILAAISTVAFSGMQQRGRDTVRAADVSNIVKGLAALTTDEREWPASAAATRTALADNLPDGILDKLSDAPAQSTSSTTTYTYIPCGNPITGAQVRYIKEQDGSTVTTTIPASVGCPAT